MTTNAVDRFKTYLRRSIECKEKEAMHIVRELARVAVIHFITAISDADPEAWLALHDAFCPKMPKCYEGLGHSWEEYAEIIIKALLHAAKALRKDKP